MNWDKLKIFHAVAEAGSFTSATVVLNISQSAISRQIQSLEEDLNVKLFERHARGLTLTENGEYVYKTAREVISKLKEVETSLGDKKNKHNDYLKSIGAKNIINSSEFDKDSRPLDKGLWDCAVDTVGGKILANVLAQTKDSGIVAACGNASDIKLNTTVMPFIIRGVKLWGINSVNTSKKRREFVWNEASKLIDFEKLNKSIKIIGLEELLDVYSKMLKGETSGRYIINLNK